MGNLKWVFMHGNEMYAPIIGLEDDFRSVSTWFHGATETQCVLTCSQSYRPTLMPTTVSPSANPSTGPSFLPTEVPSEEPSIAPTLMPRYTMDVEQHLSGVDENQWVSFGLQSLYIDTLAFMFDVESKEIEIVSVESMQMYNNRRMLQKGQTPSLRVLSRISFVDYERFAIHRDTLSDPAGRVAMNGYFAYLFSTSESSVQGVDVAHMGIEGEFDLISYFTTTSPTMTPSEVPTPQPTYHPSPAGNAVQIQEITFGTELVLYFEGASYDDGQLHDLLLDFLNEDGFERRSIPVDTSIVRVGIEDEVHMVVIDLDCEFTECANDYRNATTIESIESEIRSNSAYSEFSILSSDVGKLEDQQMQVSMLRAGSSAEMFFPFVIGALVLAMLFLCWNYWRKLFCLGGEKSFEVQIGEPLEGAVMEVAHKSQIKRFKTMSTASVFESSATFDFEGEYVTGWEQEGFAPTGGVGGVAINVVEEIQPYVAPAKVLINGESEDGLGLYEYNRRSTQEYQQDVYSTPMNGTTPGKRDICYGRNTSSSSFINCDSDSEVVWYGGQQNTRGEILETAHPTPKHNSMWE